MKIFDAMQLQREADHTVFDDKNAFYELTVDYENIIEGSFV